MGSNESVSRVITPQMREERERLLNTRINKISLIMKPANKFVEGYEIAVAGFSMLLPACMSCANRNHVGIFIFGENNSFDGVYMEFGAYNYKNEADVNSTVHYWQGNDGLRFFSINYFDIDGIRYDCDVEYNMSLRTLLTGISHHGWTKRDYEELYYEPALQMFLHKDSKDFAKKIIKRLGAKRINKKDRIRSFAKTFVPGDIIDSLEKNENNINFEERIPIIGAIAGMIKMAIADDTN